MLSEALTILKGVGPALAKKLEKLGLFRVEDLLFLLPLRYEDRTQLIKIGALAAAATCSSASVTAAVSLRCGSFISHASNKRNSRLARTLRASARCAADLPGSR